MGLPYLAQVSTLPHQEARTGAFQAVRLSEMAYAKTPIFCHSNRPIYQG